MKNCENITGHHNLSMLYKLDRKYTKGMLKEPPIDLSSIKGCRLYYLCKIAQKVIVLFLQIYLCQFNWIKRSVIVSRVSFVDLEVDKSVRTNVYSRHCRT